jgi:hypothetical protein
MGGGQPGQERGLAAARLTGEQHISAPGAVERGLDGFFQPPPLDEVRPAVRRDDIGEEAQPAAPPGESATGFAGR